MDPNVYKTTQLRIPRDPRAVDFMLSHSNPETQHTNEAKLVGYETLDPNEKSAFRGAGVAVEWISHIASGSQDDLPVVLMFHGGAYIGGSVLMQRRLSCILAKSAPCRVLSVNYR
jgi:acetyl esterase/lipase